MTMMHTMRKTIITAAAAAMGLMALSGALRAEDAHPGSREAFVAACAEREGRFEITWLYNDQGIKWGEVVSCTTETRIVACQSGVCRTLRTRPDDRLIASATSEKDD